MPKLVQFDLPMSYGPGGSLLPHFSAYLRAVSFLGCPLLIRIT